MTDTKVPLAYTITTAEGEPIVNLAEQLPPFELNVPELIEYHYGGCSSDEVTDDEIADMAIEQLNDWFFANFALGADHDSIKQKAIPAIRAALVARDAKVEAA